MAMQYVLGRMDTNLLAIHLSVVICACDSRAKVLAKSPSSVSTAIRSSPHPRHLQRTISADRSQFLPSRLFLKANWVPKFPIRALLVCTKGKFESARTSRINLKISPNSAQYVKIKKYECNILTILYIYIKLYFFKCAFQAFSPNFVA